MHQFLLNFLQDLKKKSEILIGPQQQGRYRYLNNYFKTLNSQPKSFHIFKKINKCLRDKWEKVYCTIKIALMGKKIHNL